MPRSRVRTRALIATVAATASLTVGVVALTPTGASAAPRAAQAAAAPVVAPSDVRLVQVRHSLLGSHSWYQQTYQGVPVYHGWYAIHRLRTGSYAEDGRLAVGAVATTKATVPAAQARSAAAASGVRGFRSTLMVLAGSPSRLVWVVDGTVRTALVDATSGKVAKVVDTAHYVDGKGNVFDPNPVVALQDEGLKDQNNSDTAVPASAYSKVTLHNLDGSGKLVGTWAKIDSAKGGLAHSATEKFVYTRGDGRFEQVMGYYAEDKLQGYLHSIGFDDVNAEQQDLNINTIPDDNSFYSPNADTITLGRGGVDDAEDIEVIWHESGHAVQDDQVPGFGSTEQAGAMGEGFGDYLAMTMSQINSPDTATTPIACIMDWDSTFYTSGTPHCLRRTDTNKTTDNIDGEVHDDGEIWSRALRDINLALGRVNADKVIIEAQFQFTPDTNFAKGATTTVKTAKALQTTLGLSDAQVAAVKKAFTDRKIQVG